jgi:hypothetical protein
LGNGAHIWTYGIGEKRPEFLCTGPAKSDFVLLVRFYVKHFFTYPYDINIVNS